MAVGNTITGSIANSLDVVVAAARNQREKAGNGVMKGLVEKESLSEGTGLDWKEVDIEKLSAQRITETTKLDNPQQYADNELLITPLPIGIHTWISDRVGRRMSKKAFAKLGVGAGRAMERFEDEDLLVAVDGFTTTLCGTGTTLTSGYITAGQARIHAYTQAGPDPINCVLHTYGIKDLGDELVASIGTYPLTAGRTADTYANGFKGSISGVNIHEDNNITVDGTPDAKGGVFSKMALILVRGHALRKATVRDEATGGGGTNTYIYMEYGIGERVAGYWGFEIQHDATAPTS